MAQESRTQSQSEHYFSVGLKSASNSRLRSFATPTKASLAKMKRKLRSSGKDEQSRNTPRALRPFAFALPGNQSKTAITVQKPLVSSSAPHGISEGRGHDNKRSGQPSVKRSNIVSGKKRKLDSRSKECLQKVERDLHTLSSLLLGNKENVNVNIKEKEGAVSEELRRENISLKEEVSKLKNRLTLLQKENESLRETNAELMESQFDADSVPASERLEKDRLAFEEKTMFKFPATSQNYQPQDWEVDLEASVKQDAVNPFQRSPKSMGREVTSDIFQEKGFMDESVASAQPDPSESGLGFNDTTVDSLENDAWNPNEELQESLMFPCSFGTSN